MTVGAGVGGGVLVGAVVGAGVIVGSGVGAGASVAAATKRTRKSRMLLNAIASSQQNLQHGSVESEQEKQAKKSRPYFFRLRS